MDSLNKFPKVLVSCPTASAKNYCFEDWIENVLSFTYPNFDVRIFDNTLDDGANAQYLNNLVDEKYGVAGPFKKFNAYNSQLINNVKGESSVIARMARSHNDCRAFAIANNYDYLLHLESDVFPPKDVIESLIFGNKDVVGAIFYRDEGRHRCLMAQRRIYCTASIIKCINLTASEDLPYLDGKLHEVASVGLGCVLINTKKVFRKIKFRYVEKENMHPDSFFSEDCYRNKIKIFLDTNVICRHENRQWGVYGIDFK
jgi:cellulose synthase/poly-beta-1,6-N-acetylglucosamine synthase-like glycosyltransferase